MMLPPVHRSPRLQHALDIRAPGALHRKASGARAVIPTRQGKVGSKRYCLDYLGSALFSPFSTAEANPRNRFTPFFASFNW